MQNIAVRIAIMIVLKTIEIGVNVADVVALFTDPERNLMQLLEDRFVGRCIRMCYVMRINRIVRKSPCVINADGPPDFGVINVVFEVTAITYTTGEIINGCRVVSKEALRGIADTIICSTQYADIQLNNIPLLDSVRPGQFISVRVGEAKYTLGSDKIAINAVPFVLTKVPTVFHYTPAQLPADFADFLERFYSQLQMLETEVATMREKNTAAWKTFENTLYAYTAPQSAPESAKETSILDLIRAPPATECWLTRDPRVRPSSPNVYMYGEPPREAVESVPAVTILVTLLDEYYNILRSVVEYINIYNTQELLDSHRNLWLIFAEMKK